MSMNIGDDYAQGSTKKIIESLNQSCEGGTRNRSRYDYINN